MTNVPQEVLRHGVSLIQGARDRHDQLGLKPERRTSLVTPDILWVIHVEQTKRSGNAPAPFLYGAPARLGHVAAGAISGRPSLYDRTLIGAGSGRRGQDISLVASHDVTNQRLSSKPDWPYLMAVGYGDANETHQAVPADSDRAKEVAEAFLSLTLNHVRLSTERTPEGKASDYRRMRRNVEGLAAVHGRVAMDGTNYYFNNGDHMVHITGRDRDHPIGFGPAGATSLVREDAVEMNIFSMQDGKMEALVASVNGYDSRDGRLPMTYAYEQMRTDLMSRELNDGEAAAAVHIFEAFCQLDTSYAFVEPAPLGLQDLDRLKERRELEIAVRPEAQVNLRPLHLEPRSH